MPVGSICAVDLSAETALSARLPVGYVPLLAYLGWTLTTWIVKVVLDAQEVRPLFPASPTTSRSLVYDADVKGERSESAGREAPLTSASKTKRSRGGEAVRSLTNWRDWSNGRAPVAHGL